MEMNGGFPIDADDLLRALDAADDAVYVADRSGQVVFANRAVAQILGADASDIIGSSTRIFRSGIMSEEYYERLWSTVLAGNVWRERITNRRRSGELYEAAQTITPVRDHSGVVTHFIAVQRDLSRAREFENEDARALTQLTDIAEHRTLLLRELNHRVKNDLQIARSLLVLRGDQIDDERARAIIGEAAERLDHAARIYGLLSERASDETVPLSAFLRQMEAAWHTTRDLVATVDLGPDDGDLTVPSSLALSIGLVIHELVTNATKYAEARGTSPTLTVLRDGDLLRLQIRDHGAGYPADVLTGRRRGLGLTLIETLVDRMAGHLSMSNDGGAVTEVVVPIPA